jgi:hypothetical protein
MFADSGVPQVLSHEGVLVYWPKWKTRLERKEIIRYRDTDECELRVA